MCLNLLDGKNLKIENINKRYIKEILSNIVK